MISSAIILASILSEPGRLAIGGVWLHTTDKPPQGGGVGLEKGQGN